MVSSQEVFYIRTKKEFEKKALKIFRLQAKKNPVYKIYTEQLEVDPGKVKSISAIPFLPIEFFKTQKVVTTGRGSERRTSRRDLGLSSEWIVGKTTRSSSVRISHSALFLSSGTTGMERSRHYVSDIRVYEKSFRTCFDRVYGKVTQYFLLAYLPSYYENENSSLLYMVNDLIRKSKKKESRLYLHNEQEELFKTLNRLLSEKRKVLLFGVSYALLDLMVGRFPLVKRDGQDLIVLETGGMKGRSKEITREELHNILCRKFGVGKVHSEYGMTELLSQAYSKGDGIFNCPPWMKVLVRDVNDPFSFLPPGKTGGLNIIDLANIHSCSFIATQDVGRTHPNKSFEVLGRLDHSDLRGCNLLAG